MASLQEFAAGLRRTLKCWACAIPETEEINQGRRDGIQIPRIREWLIREKGYSPDEATLHKLTHHFSNMRHHESR